MNKQDILYIPDTSLISLIGDEMIALELDSGMYIEFNFVAGKIIELIRTNKKITYEKLLSKLSNLYDQDISDIENDVEDFINQAITKKLLKKVNCHS